MSEMKYCCEKFTEAASGENPSMELQSDGQAWIISGNEVVAVTGVIFCPFCGKRLPGGNNEMESHGKAWIAVGTTTQYGRVYLTDYAAIDQHGVGVKIMDRARSEGFRGTLDSRLAELGWEIVCVSLKEVPPNA